MLFSIYLTTVILTFDLFRIVCPSCVLHNGKYDLSSLDWPTGWPVAGPIINGSVTHYEINLCHPLNYTSSLKEGCPKSSVCHILGNKSISYGNAVENKSDYAVVADTGNGFSLFLLTGSQCDKTGTYRATINFACGPHLGAPELILRNDCQVNFYWRTSAACSRKPKPEVPCYVIDKQGNKRDLSYLIQNKGGYFVNTPNPSVDFVINVCSNILLDNKTQSCPENTSSCRIIGSDHLSFGNLQERLQYTQEGLVLIYRTNSTVPGCQLKPKTTVLFKCPSRGYSQPPKLISDSNCQYEVEWETEYACPESLLKGNFKTCQFTAEKHGVEIDLSPLQKKQAFDVNSSLPNTTFALSVCGGLDNFSNFSCDGKHWKSTSVCLINATSNSSTVVGKTDGSKFIYADGEIILVYPYPKGTICENGEEQSSVINFICDPKASNDGEPRHVSSQNCMHMFEWPTKYACLKHPLDTPCSVTYDKKKVNLQKLLLVDDEAWWEAIDIRNGQRVFGDEYFINVCGQVSGLGNLSRCGVGSSACVLLSNGQYLNLGNFTSPPIYDDVSNSVRLEYTGGSPCGNGKLWKSSIDFICRPGDINSEPFLTNINEKECSYEFEWHTAEACPEGMIEGSNCKVYDSNLGINYDLSILKSKQYVIESDLYKFYLGVCEPVVDSPCSKEGSQGVGVCQVDKSTNASWNTGEPNSRLSYMDGVVNLTYLSGDPYNDQNKTSRMTIIIFICDYKEGHGKPYFVEEVNFAYVFHWYTGLVCPHSVSTECTAHDPYSHLLYDLSGLSIPKQNWMVIINEDDRERKIYLNVCRSLALPVGCYSGAAACIVENTDDGEKVIVSNIGRAISPPAIDSPGHLILSYTSGDPCVAFGKNITYSTVIHFLCAEDKMSTSGLRFLNKVGACEYAFLWTTKAACPTGELVSKDTCQLTDPDSGFTFDLTSLQRKRPYTVSAPSDTYQLNICGKVVDGCYNSDGKPQLKNVSVCKVDGDDKLTSEIALANSYVLSYSTGRDLSLIYKGIRNGNGDEIEAIIKFPCHNSTTGPKFIKVENEQHIFEMKTFLTCIPSQFDCNIIDHFGNEYDLSPLAKYSNGNWEVSDNRPEYSHLRYHINFCRPLNKVSTYKCPGGASASCQTSATQTENIGYDLGSQLNEPIVSSKGTVVVRFTNGSYCHNGVFKRSTTINLFCSEKEGDLKFIGETPECEYEFSLGTPVACPIQSSHGSNCIVKDPMFGYMFDLNPLKSKINNYNITVGEYSFLFNVCGKLNGLDNECSNSGACQMKPNDTKFSKSLGLPNDNLVYRKGVITLEYKSGSSNCHGKYNRSTYITFMCNHAHEDKDGPYFISEAEDCTYLFEWPTVHACPPFEVTECSVLDNNGVHYDLSKLSLPHDNYYIKYPFSDKKTFVLNVCRSIVHTPDSLCSYTSAACLIDSSNTVEPVNLGRVSQTPYFEDGKIKINYTSGDPCDEEHTSSARFMQTIIEFTCDEHSLISTPEFVGKDGCTYYFDWFTVFACPAKIPVSTGDCTVEDPLTGHLFNLSSLKNHSGFKTQSNHHQYFLSICNNDSSNPCGSEAGVCQEEMSGGKRHWNTGKPNSNLMYNGGVLFLNYSDGDSCHNNLFQRNTIIEFQCGYGIGEPEFVSETYDCTYFFSWKTEYACQPLLHCAVKNGSNYYDLTSLAESYHGASSSVLNDSASYYISICNSFNKMPGIPCPPESAVCRITRAPQSGLMVIESLGKVEHPPFIDFMGHATVLYTNGSACYQNPNTHNRARVIFLCDAGAGMGHPVLLEDDECLFVFEWRTNVVCPEKPEITPVYTSCNYTDKSRGIHFDLLSLQKKGPAYYEVVSGENRESKYYLNVCGSLHGSNITECADSGICVKEGNTAHSYGVASSQKFTFDGRRLRLTFTDGSDCPSGLNGKRTSEIFFICDPSAHMGKPVLHKKYTCLAVFMWKTALVCQSVQQRCSFDVGGSHYDFNLLSSLSHNWNTTDGKNMYYINPCRGIQPAKDTLLCSPAAAVCMVDSNGFHIPLGMAQTVEARTINSTDLLLTFESGDERACSYLGTNTFSPVTRLFMRCGASLGNPKIFSPPDSKCYYDFIWESSLACSNKTEEVMMEKDGLIQDNRLGFSFDIKSILNRTFAIPGTSLGDDYMYMINLSGVSNVSEPANACSKAAVCQTKPFSTFRRDIGSSDTRIFILRGSELHMVFVSHTKPCGKNKSKNVTTLINLQCVSAAGVGSPVFLYESGDCDYIFEWETIAVCPDFHKKKANDDSSDNDPQPKPFIEESHSSHNAEIAVGVISAIVIVMVIVFIVMKSERRAILSSRFRGLFGRVSVPYFRYKRGDVLTELQSDF